MADLRELRLAWRYTIRNQYHHEHDWGLWAATALYFGQIVSVRRCKWFPAADRRLPLERRGFCSALELQVFGSEGDERCNRIASYLTRRLARGLP